MKASILSTIAAFLLPMAAIAAPTDEPYDLVKRDCPSIFSLRLAIEDNSTYWLAPYRTRYTASGSRGRIFAKDFYDTYILTNDTILEVVHTDIPPEWITEAPRFGYAFPLTSGNLAMFFAKQEEYFEENPDRAENKQDFVVTTIDPATCEVTLSFGGQKLYPHFPATGYGAPTITLRTDAVPRENAHAVQTIWAVPENPRPN